MNRLRMISAATVALTVAGLATGATAAHAGTAATERATHAATHAAAHPAAPSDVRAYETAGGVKITWMDPRSAYDHLAFRYRRGTTAPTIKQGKALAVTKHAKSAILTKLVPGAAYAVSIWTRKGTSTYSTKATVSFHTPRRSTTVTRDKGVLSGTVTDVAGHPLKGATVFADNESEFSSDFEYATTDRNGAYSITTPAGRYSVDVVAAHAVGGDSDDTGYNSDSKEARVRAKTTTTLRFTVTAAGAITGRIVDKAGHPLAGIGVYEQTVSAVAPYSDNGFFSFGSGGFSYAVSRKDGTYTLKGALAYASVLCFQQEDYVPSAPAGYRPHCGKKTFAAAGHVTRAAGTTTMAPGTAGSIATTVTSPSGRRIADVALMFEPQSAGAFDDSFDEGGYDTTGKDGRALDHGLPAGKWQVCAYASSGTKGLPAASGYRSTCKTVHVAAGGTTSVTLRLSLGAAITGTVVGPHGPLANVGVIVASPALNIGGEATTDAAGRYEMQGLPASSYVVCAEASQPQPKATTGTRSTCAGKKTRFPATAGTTRILDIGVTSGAAVKGTVRTTDGADVSAADVFAYTKNDDGGYGVDTDAHGRFLLGGLGAARYSVCAETEYLSGISPHSCSAATTKLRHTTSVALTLPAAGTVVAKATDADGNPLSGVDAVLLKSCSRADVSDAIYGGCGPVAAYGDTRKVTPVASANTLADGTVPLEGVAPGNYALCLLGSQAAAPTADVPASGVQDTCTSDTDVVVTAGAVTTRTLAMGEGASVSGRVTGPDGKGIGKVRVYIAHSAVIAQADADEYGVAPADAVTAADGTYTVRSVAPGARTVCFDASAAGTSTSGFQDECIGGTPGETDTAAPVTLAAGANTGVNQVLQTGPAGGSRAIARTVRSADPAKHSRTGGFVLVDGGHSVKTITRPADDLLAGLRAMLRTTGTSAARTRVGAARLQAFLTAAHGALHR